MVVYVYQHCNTNHLSAYGQRKGPAMKTTIYTTHDLQYTLTDPMRRRTLTFDCILHAITYCRHEGLVYRLAF
jgi:hypothetical protein